MITLFSLLQLADDFDYCFKFCLATYGFPVQVYLHPCTGPVTLCIAARLVCPQLASPRPLQCSFCTHAPITGAAAAVAVEVIWSNLKGTRVSPTRLAFRTLQALTRSRSSLHPSSTVCARCLTLQPMIRRTGAWWWRFVALYRWRYVSGWDECMRLVRATVLYFVTGCTH